MSSFSNWLSQRDNNTYNELFEPNLIGKDQETRRKNWLVSNPDKTASANIKDFLMVKTSEKWGCEAVYLTDTGKEFLNREDIDVSERMDKLGRALGSLFEKMDDYGGLLLLPPFSPYIRFNNTYLVAIDRVVKLHNLEMKTNGRLAIVYNSDGEANYPELINRIK